jgi:hypothetical protein
MNEQRKEKRAKHEEKKKCARCVTDGDDGQFAPDVESSPETARWYAPK